MNSTVMVLHAAETIKGGIATYLKELLPLQVDEFGEGRVVLIVPFSQISELGNLNGVRLLTFDDSRGRAQNSISLGILVLKQLFKLTPKVLHIHSTFAGVVLRFLAPVFVFKNIFIVYCPHGWAVDRSLSGLNKKIIGWIERFLSVFSDVIICISRHEYEVAQNIGIGIKKLRLVENGISIQSPIPDGFLPPWPNESDVKKILFVGRFDKQKGVDVLINAMKLLGRKAHCILVGDSVLGDSFVSVLPENVTAVGWVKPNRLQSLLESAHAIVIPSRWEGFGLVAVEGMRARLPVIASRVGGLEGIVEQNVTGILVNPADAYSLVSAIDECSIEMFKRMGLAGRLRFEKLYTIDRVHSQLLGIYDGKTA